MVRTFWAILSVAFISCQLAEAKGPFEEPQRLTIGEITSFVNYGPQKLVGYGVMLDLCALEAEDSLSVRQKQLLISQTCAIKNVEEAQRFLQDEPIASFGRVVRVEIDLTDTATEDEALDCRVISLSGDPLPGGYLLPTAMKAESEVESSTYGVSVGTVGQDIGDSNRGTILNGCRLIQDVVERIHRDGYCVLRVKTPYSTNQIATEIKDVLDQTFFQHQQGLAVVPLDSSLLRVPIPQAYLSNPLEFASIVEEQIIYNAARVLEQATVASEGNATTHK